MSGYRIERFAEQRRITAQDVVQLWASEADLAPAEAERRVAELLLVATDPAGRLAGVSTAYLRRNPQLRAELWHFRVFVATPHRRAHLAIELARSARDHLVERFLSGADTRGIGILYRVESELLRRGRPQAVWPDTRFVFIGEDRRGNHIRVFYFPGVNAPEPGETPARSDSAQPGSE